MDAKSPPKSRAPYVAWMLTMFFRAEDDIKGGRSSPRFTSAELKDIKEIGQRNGSLDSKRKTTTRQVETSVSLCEPSPTSNSFHTPTVPLTASLPCLLQRSLCQMMSEYSISALCQRNQSPCSPALTRHPTSKKNGHTDSSFCNEYVLITGGLFCSVLIFLLDTAPERQSGRKAQISNITAAKVGYHHGPLLNRPRWSRLERPSQTW